MSRISLTVAEAYGVLGAGILACVLTDSHLEVDRILRELTLEKKIPFWYETKRAG